MFKNQVVIITVKFNQNNTKNQKTIAFFINYLIN